MVSTYSRPYLALAGFKLCNDALGLASPLLLKLLVEWLSEPHGTRPAPPPAPRAPPFPPTPDPDYGQDYQGAGGAAAMEGGAAWLAVVSGRLAHGASQWASQVAAARRPHANVHHSPPWPPAAPAPAPMPWWWDSALVWELLSPGGRYFGWTAAAALWAACLLRALIASHYNWRLGRLNCQLRAALMCALYKKALMVSASAAAATAPDPGRRSGKGAPGVGGGGSGGSKGEVATLMSVDAGRVVNILLSFHELWSLPLQIAVALYLLYLQVGGTWSQSTVLSRFMYEFLLRTTWVTGLLLG